MLDQELVIHQYITYIKHCRGEIVSTDMELHPDFKFKPSVFKKLLKIQKVSDAFHNREIIINIHTDGEFGHVSADLPVLQDDGSTIIAKCIGLDPNPESSTFGKITGCEGKIFSQDRSTDSKQLLQAHVKVTEEQYQQIAKSLKEAINNPPDYQLLGTKNNNCIMWLDDFLRRNGVSQGLENKFDYDQFRRLDPKAIKIEAQLFFNDYYHSNRNVEGISMPNNDMIATRYHEWYENKKLTTDIECFEQYHAKKNNSTAPQEVSLPLNETNHWPDSKNLTALTTALGEGGLIDNLLHAADAAKPSHAAECQLLIDTLEAKVLDGIKELNEELEALRIDSVEGQQAQKKDKINQATLMVFEIVSKIFAAHLEAKARKYQLGCQIKEINRQIKYLDIQFEASQLNVLVGLNPSPQLHERIGQVLIQSVRGSVQQQLDVQRAVAHSFDQSRKRFERYRVYSQVFEVHYEALKNLMDDISGELCQLNRSSAFGQLITDLTLVTATVATFSQHPAAMATALALTAVSTVSNFRNTKKITTLNDRFAEIQQSAVINQAGFERSHQLSVQYLTLGRQAISFLIENKHLVSPEMLYNYIKKQIELEAQQGTDLAAQKVKADRDHYNATQQLIHLNNKWSKGKNLKDGELLSARSSATNAAQKRDQVNDAVEDNLERQGQLGLQAAALRAYQPALTAMFQFASRHLPSDKRPDEDLFDQLKAQQQNKGGYSQGELDEYNRLKADLEAKEKALAALRETNGTSASVQKAGNDVKDAKAAMGSYACKRPFIGYTKTDWTGDIMSCFSEAFKGGKDSDAAKTAFIDAFIKLNAEKEITVTKNEAEMIYNQNVQRAGHAMIIDSFNEQQRRLNEHHGRYDQIAYSVLGSLRQLSNQLRKTGWIESDSLNLIDKCLSLSATGYDFYVLGRTSYFLIGGINAALTQAAEKGLKSIVEDGTNTVLDALIGNMASAGCNIMSALATLVQLYNIAMDSEPEASPDLLVVIRKIEELRIEIKAQFSEVRDTLKHIQGDLRYLIQRVDYVIQLIEEQDLLRVANHSDRAQDLENLSKMSRRVKKSDQLQLLSKDEQRLKAVERIVQQSSDADLTGDEDQVVDIRGDLQALLSSNPWMTVNSLRRKLNPLNKHYEFENKPLSNVQLLIIAYKELLALRPKFAEGSLHQQTCNRIFEDLKTRLANLYEFYNYVAHFDNWIAVPENGLSTCLQAIEEKVKSIDKDVQSQVANNAHQFSSTNGYQNVLNDLKSVFPEKHNVNVAIWQETLHALDRARAAPPEGVTISVPPEDVTISVPLLKRKAGTPTPTICIDKGIILEPAANLKERMAPLIFPKQFIERVKVQNPELNELIEHENTGLIKLKYEYAMIKENNQVRVCLCVSYVVADSTNFEHFNLYPMFKLTMPEMDRDCKDQWHLHALSEFIYGKYGNFFDYNLPRAVENTYLLSLQHKKGIGVTVESQLGFAWTKSDLPELIKLIRYEDMNLFDPLNYINVNTAIATYTTGNAMKHGIFAVPYVFWAIGRSIYQGLSKHTSLVEDKGTAAYLERQGLYDLLEKTKNVAKLRDRDLATECNFSFGLDGDRQLRSKSGAIDVRKPLSFTNVGFNSSKGRGAEKKESSQDGVMWRATSIIQRSLYTKQRNLLNSIEKGGISRLLDQYAKHYGTLILAMRFLYRLSYEESVSVLETGYHYPHPIKLVVLLEKCPEKLPTIRQKLTLNLSQSTEELEVSETKLAISKLAAAFRGDNGGFVQSERLSINFEHEVLELVDRKINRNACAEFQTAAKGPGREQIAQQSTILPQDNNVSLSFAAPLSYGAVKKVSCDKHWYEALEINTLMRIHPINETINIFSPIPVTPTYKNGPDLNTTLDDYKTQRKLDAEERAKNKCFIPVNIDEVHWVLIYIMYGENDQKPTFYYFDPMGGDCPSGITDAIIKNYPQNEIITIGQRVQRDGYNCGPWIVVAMRMLADNGAFPDADVDINAERAKQQDELSNEPLQYLGENIPIVDKQDKSAEKPKLAQNNGTFFSQPRKYSDGKEEVDRPILMMG